MIQWHFAADNDALRSEAGEKRKGRIVVRSWTGLAVVGPGVDLPAGKGIARILLDGPSRGKARLEITADGGKNTVASQFVDLGNGTSLVIELPFELVSDRSACEVRLHCWGRVRAEIIAVEFDIWRALAPESIDPTRQVGYESRKSYAEKIESGFFEKYLSGPAILEVGYQGYEHGNVPIVPQAIGLDIGYPGYDGESFPFADNSLDGVYSSHCFEHIGPWKAVLQDWHRILKPGGFLVIVVPHQFLFERKRRLPSPINPDHKRFYTAGSLLAEIEEAFEDNTFRVRHLVENDKGFDYNLLPYQGTDGCYEIELVIEKLATPRWHPDDGTVRPYGASEFFLKPANVALGPWEVELDISNPTECMVWGPYVGLGAGDYEVDFYFRLDEQTRALKPDMMLDVGKFGTPLEIFRTKGEAGEEFFRTGKATLRFHNDENGTIFEFRVWAPGKGSPARPHFQGIVLRYADSPAMKLSGA